MNVLYNIADVTLNIGSNEGFGLSSAESIMAGTPVIINVTGGLQDQIGQLDDEGKPVQFTREFGTNSCKKYTKHGIWAKAVWPGVRYVQGSPATPYIIDEICKWEDVAEAMMYWYMMTPEDREKCGLEGRRWAMNEGLINSEYMCNEFIKAMDYTIEHFEPVKPFSVHTADEFVGHKLPDGCLGVEIPKIDTDKIQEEINSVITKGNK